MVRRFSLLAAWMAAFVIVLSLAGAAAQDAGGPPTPAATEIPGWLAEAIDDYGSFALFGAFVISGVGLHLSEDLILIPAGWLAAHDLGMFVKFWVWAYLGIVVGDGLWFWMCGHFGTRFLHSKFFKRAIHPRRLLEIKHQIDERGAFVLFAARFIPGTRTPVITMCGLLHMAWWKFLLVECSCAAVTVPLQMLVGVAGARAAEEVGVTDHTHKIMIAVGLTLGFVLLMYLVHKWISARKAKRRTPRAPARWLRLYQATRRLVTQVQPRSNS